MTELLELGRRVLASQSFSAELVRLKPGEAEISLPLDPERLQQNGYARDGVLSFMGDNGITFTGGSVLGPSVLMQEFKVSFLRPGRGESLVARRVRAARLTPTRRRPLRRVRRRRGRRGAVRHCPRHRRHRRPLTSEPGHTDDRRNHP